jgi:hypothetical protein
MSMVGDVWGGVGRLLLRAPRDALSSCLPMLQMADLNETLVGMRAETELLIVDDNSRDGSGTSSQIILSSSPLRPAPRLAAAPPQIRHVIRRQHQPADTMCLAEETVVALQGEGFPVRIIVRTSERGLSSAVLRGFKDGCVGLGFRLGFSV